MSYLPQEMPSPWQKPPIAWPNSAGGLAVTLFREGSKRRVIDVKYNIAKEWRGIIVAQIPFSF